MTKLLLLITAFLISFSGPALAEDWENKLENHLSKVKYLEPKDFPELPRNIVLELTTRGCTIPQSYLGPYPEAQKYLGTPNNVIKGDFSGENSDEWAVICSINEVSSILVFLKGTTEEIAFFELGKDKDLIDVETDGTVLFIRHIKTTTREDILHYQRMYQAPEFDSYNTG